ncbi:MAG: DNA internalization-related competence protein ComEC/Rec2 [Betaproteobacteria bacterium HGW-Betaproteobacteria-8]|nr:MAG: DNA internalization-related competence protein ComEC/Rec2 [Betaproteobacteria bacterium HGW-Betaproteobacteria-8]
MTVLALIFVFGAWALQQLPVLPNLFWALTVIPLAFTAFFTRHSAVLIFKTLHQVSLVTLAFALGFFWAAGFAQMRLADQLPKEWERRDIQVIGVIAGMPQSHERGQRFEFDVEQMLTPDAVIPGHISLSHYENGFADPDSTVKQDGESSTYRAGQRWRLTVRVKRPHSTLNPHGFDFEAWSLERNIRATGYIRKQDGNQMLDAVVYRPRYMVEMLRERIRDRMNAVLQDQPYGGVLRALAIGDDDDISLADWQVFLKTGTNHLMSISGLHITMLAGLAFSASYTLWRRSERLVISLPARKAATIIGALVALAYSLMAGFSIPTQRTLYMLSVFAVALWFGRHISIARVLAYALLIVVILDPWAVLAAGFWLSFGAVAVIAYALSGRLRKPHWLREAIGTQWAVTLGLIPLLLMMFQQVSIISPLANALAIPLISLVVVPVTLLGVVLPVDAILLIAHQAIHFCMVVLEWMAGSSLSVWQQQAPPFWTLPLAITGVLWLLLPRGWPMRWLGIVGLLPMFLLESPRPAHGAMQVAVLDVGQGLSVVVKTQAHTLLYDAGPIYSSQSDSGNRIIAPYLRASGVRHLDSLLISHDDNDHSGGAASILEQVPVSRVLSSLPRRNPLIAARANEHCHTGQSWQWDGVVFEMIFPDIDSYQKPGIKDNDRSCVLRITSQFGRLLIPGDIERGAENALLRSEYSLKSDVLIAPHHGSKTSSTWAFLEEVDPAAVVLTAGYLNRFRHPHPTVIQRYEDLGSKIYRSDQDGAIIIDFAAESGIEIMRWRQYAKRYWHQDFLLHTRDGVS